MNAGRRGFTLIELMVSMVLLTLLSLVLVSMIDSTASTWRYTSGKIEQFRAAREGFESITRRLSQATLNAYWDYEYDASGSGYPARYVRASELRFLSGPAETLAGTGAPPRPSHGIFFQAPLGFVDDAEYSGLDNLLNTWGYYVEFNQDIRPPFLDGLSNPPPRRWRYRLMELMEPSNKLALYARTSGQAAYDGEEWFTDALASSAPPAHVLAENIIALVLLPKLSPKDQAAGGPGPGAYTAASLAPDYMYDTTRTNTDPKLDPRHQLPPLLQVTMVAIDEVSARRLAQGSTPPDFGVDSLFQDATRYDTDLATLQRTLSDQRVSFRVFTSNVGIRAAKWSRN